MVWPLHSQPTMDQSGGNRPYGCVHVPTGGCGWGQDNVPVLVTSLPKSFIDPDEGCECAYPSQPIGMTGCHGCVRSQGHSQKIEHKQMCIAVVESDLAVIDKFGFWERFVPFLSKG